MYNLLPAVSPGPLFWDPVLSAAPTVVALSDAQLLSLLQIAFLSQHKASHFGAASVGFLHSNPALSALY